MYDHFLVTAVLCGAMGTLVGLVVSFRHATGNGRDMLIAFLFWTFGYGATFGFGSILIHLVWSILFPKRILLWLADADRIGQAKMIERKKRCWE